MSLALNKEQLAVLAMKEAMAWLDQRRVYYQLFPPDQIKIGTINFWPRTGTITVDGEGQRRAEKGLVGLEVILAAAATPRHRGTSTSIRGPSL